MKAASNPNLVAWLPACRQNPASHPPEHAQVQRANDPVANGLASAEGKTPRLARTNADFPWESPF